jgi:hypothetical protein
MVWSFELAVGDAEDVADLAATAQALQAKAGATAQAKWNRRRCMVVDAFRLSP